MIVISELNIKATVTDEKKQSVQDIDLRELKEKIVKECIENVLQIIEDKKKR